jgi:hypothetical protein
MESEKKGDQTAHDRPVPGTSWPWGCPAKRPDGEREGPPSLVSLEALTPRMAVLLGRCRGSPPNGVHGESILVSPCCLGHVDHCRADEFSPLSPRSALWLAPLCRVPLGHAVSCHPCSRLFVLATKAFLSRFLSGRCTGHTEVTLRAGSRPMPLGVVCRFSPCRREPGTVPARPLTGDRGAPGPRMDARPYFALSWRKREHGNAHIQ